MIRLHDDSLRADENPPEIMVGVPRQRLARWAVILAIVVVTVSSVLHFICYRWSMYSAIRLSFDEVRNVVKIAGLTVDQDQESQQTQDQTYRELLNTLGRSSVNLRLTVNSGEEQFYIPENEKGIGNLVNDSIVVNRETGEEFSFATVARPGQIWSGIVRDGNDDVFLTSFLANSNDRGYVLGYMPLDSVITSAKHAIAGWFVASGFCVLVLYPIAFFIMHRAFRRAYQMASQAQHACAQTERRVRQIFEDNDVAKMIIEPSTRRIMEANTAATLLYGFSRDELRTRSFDLLSLDPPVDTPISDKDNWRSTRIETHLDRSGQERFVQVHRCRVEYDDAPKELLILHDVTDEQRAEKKLLQFIEEAQQRIGKDLHEGIGQQLAGASLWIAGVLEEMESGRVPAINDVRKAQTVLDEALRKTRKLGHGLDHLDSNNTALQVTLDRLCSLISEVFNVKCGYTSLSQVDLCDGNQAVLTKIYRIAQDCIYNLIRFYGATELNVACELDEHCTQLILSIEYNETCDPANNSDVIRDIARHWVTIAGGRTGIRTRRDGWTTLIVTLPQQSILC